MKRNASVLFCLCLITLLPCFGCMDQTATLTNSYPYHDIILGFNYTGSQRVAFAVFDQRAAVVSGAKSPIYTGVVMDIVRHKADTTTESGQQLATDMTKSICMSLKYNGFRAIPVFVAHSDTPDAVMNKLFRTKASRFGLVTLYIWESQTYKNTTLVYHLRLDIYNRDRKLLASKTSAGEADVAGKISGPHTSAKILVPDLVRRQLETVFNDFQIAEALK